VESQGTGEREREDDDLPAALYFDTIAIVWREQNSLLARQPFHLDQERGKNKEEKKESKIRERQHRQTDRRAQR